MGMFESLKKATGLGLSPREHYDRAWEKGVLLGRERYGEAASLFESALRKAEEASDAQLASRCRANAALYGWLATGTDGGLRALRQALEGLQDIEAVGSRSLTMPADQLRTELDARLLESELNGLAADAHERRAKLHGQASDVFKRIFSQGLLTYRYHSPDAHVELAQARFFLHQGLQAWHGALSLADSDAEMAAESAARAVAGFRQCKDETWLKKAESLVSSLRTRRTCWMCHRELAGLDIHVKSYPAVVTPYVVAAVARLGHDLSSIDEDNGAIMLCVPCGSAVEWQAEAHAEERVGELRAELIPIVTSLQRAIAELESEVEDLRLRMPVK